MYLAKYEDSSGGRGGKKKRKNPVLIQSHLFSQLYTAQEEEE